LTHAVMRKGIEDALMNLEGCTMQIFVMTPDGKTITLNIKESDTVERVKAAVMDSRSCLTFAGKPLVDNNKTMKNIRVRSESALFESMRMDGGGVFKKHLKAPEALAECKNRAATNMKAAIKASLSRSRSDALEAKSEGVEQHDAITHFVKDMKQSIHDLKMLQATGTDVIHTGLRTIPFEVLTQIATALSPTSGRRQGSEEKLQTVLPLVFPNLKLMDAAQQRIISEQVLMLEELLKIFIDEFHIYHGGQTQIDLQIFVKMVEKEIGRRDDGRVEPEKNRCTIL
jgi:hypothetical protein